MKNVKKNVKYKNSGFTLIELLAVIIILGILMIIAIPSVTSYINNSRKSAYVDTAKELVSGARTFVNEGKVEMYDTGTTYYIDYGCVKTENTSKSPYGDFTNAYIVVTYDGNGYTYYWISRDETGQGVKTIIKSDELDEDDIISDIGVDEVQPTTTLGERTTVTLINSSCEKIEGTALKHASETGETSFTLTYNNQDGTGCTTKTGNYMEEWGELCTPTRDDDYSFQGWYTQPNGQGNEITVTSLVTGNITVYSKWGIPPVCKRATTLHTATCSRTQGGCYASGYNEGATTNSKNTKTITYGNTSTTEGTLTSGDAFDCDVNSDGIYDEENERFYYVTDENDKAVLIYYGNISNDGTTISAPVQSTYRYDLSNTYSGPRNAILQLPTITQWSNKKLEYPTIRQITNQNDGLLSNDQKLNTFDYTGRAARLLTYQDVQSACGDNPRTSYGYLDNCNFLLENVRNYLQINAFGEDGYWLETPAAGASRVWHIEGGTRSLASSTYSVSRPVRPTIIVSKFNIEY